MYIESPLDQCFGCTRVVIISTLKANCLPVRYNNFDLGQCKRNFGLHPTTFILCHGTVGGAEKNKHVITQKKFILILTSHVKLLAFTWLRLWQFRCSLLVVVVPPFLARFPALPPEANKSKEVYSLAPVQLSFFLFFF